MKTQRGFTLMEVMVATVVFGLVATTMASSFISQARFNYNSSVQSGATVAAQQVMDELRLMDITSLPTSGSSAQTRAVGARTYTITTSYCVIPAYCATASTRHLQVQVAHRGRDIYAIETIFTQLR